MEHKKTLKYFGTQVTISVVSNDLDSEKRIDYVYNFFDSFEKEFSRFIPESILSLLNTNKVLEVSDRFLDLFNLSKEMYIKTNGYFNPLVNISNIGYSKSFEKSQFKKTEINVDLDLDSVIIKGNTIILGKNQNLDFGGIGKGYAADLASNILKSFGYDDFLIDIGGDMYVSGFYENSESWIIGIENPFDSSLLTTLKLSNKAIATSGGYRRKWEIDSEKYHHILNPKTLTNNFEIESVTVITDKAYKADAFTKAIFNMGPKNSLDFLQKNNLSGVIVLSNGKILYSQDMIEKYNLI